MSHKNKAGRKSAKRVTALTIELYRVGSSPSEVARLENVSPTHVTKVMKRETVSARIQKRIAKILKRPYHELWVA